jgi:hypothetical protein
MDESRVLKLNEKDVLEERQRRAERMARNPADGTRSSRNVH